MGIAIIVQIGRTRGAEGTKNVVEGTIEMGLGFDGLSSAGLDFNITDMMFVTKDGKRYTLVASKNFKFINKSSQTNNVLSLGASGRYKAKGQVVSKEKWEERATEEQRRRAIKEWEKRGKTGNIEVVTKIPQHDVFIVDILERLEQ